MHDNNLNVFGYPPTMSPSSAMLAGHDPKNCRKLRSILENTGADMDDLILTFGTLCVLFCVYAVLTHHHRTSGSDVLSSSEISRWSDTEAATPTDAVVASGTLYRREPRGSSRLRLQRCTKGSPNRVRSSRM
jgi:hypothetical protein